MTSLPQHYIPNITVPVDPLAFQGPWIYPALLGYAERTLYHRRYPAIRTSQQEQAVPRISTNNFCIPPTNGVAASLRHLETGPWWTVCPRAHGHKLNASMGAIMAHKVSGRLSYFHASATTTGCWSLWWLRNRSRTSGHCRAWWTVGVGWTMRPALCLTLPGT